MAATLVSFVPMRSLIGPFVVAAAVWAASGSLTVAGDAADVRLVVPASPLWLVAGLVLGLAFPGWRRSPLLAAPALLPVLPWLPLPLPAVFLIWSGPLAWVPVGLAALAAVMSRTATGSAVDRSRPVAGHALAAGLATLVAGGLVLYSVGDRLPGGDEPHYLVITQSLLKDGDLRIENNHANRDYAEYWGSNLAPHVVQRGQNREIYSIHAPGVAILVAPMFALFGLTGAQATILVIAAIAGALVWLAGWYATRQPGAAWFAWAGVVGSVTMLVQSVTIFPDGPGAAIVAAAVVVWLRLSRGDRVSTTMIVGTSVLLAALPFLHTRFAVLAAGLGLALAHQLFAGSDVSSRLRRVTAFLAVPSVAAVCWFSYFFVLYGTPNPMVAYGAQSESSLRYIPGGVAGLLFDQQFGLFSYSPVLVLAFLGWRHGRGHNDGASLRTLALIAGAYVATVATYWMWWAGVPATPARLATSVLPLLAAPLAVVWRDSGPARRTVAIALLASSLGITLLVLGVDGGRLAWSSRDAQAPWLWALGPVVDLPRAWPSFFWRLIGGDVSSQWPFAIHVLAWGGAFGGLLLLLRAIARPGNGNRDARVALASGVLPLGLMLAAQIGWWLNDAPALRPAPSQMALLRAVAVGKSVVELSPGGISRLAAGTVPVRITVPRVDLPGSPARWAEMRDVPAGEFEIRLAAPRPSSGTLTVRAAFSREPLQVVSLPRRSVHTIPLQLVAGTTELVFVPDDALAAGGGALVLQSRAQAPGPFVPAQARVQVDALDLYVFGGAPFVEGRAMWVRRGGAAHLGLAARDSTPRPLTIRLVNGPNRNPVEVTVAGETRRIDLESSASVAIPVTVPERGVLRVSVASPSGFRPSDDGRNPDGRYLGVRVEFGDASADPPPTVDQ
jgi:hypothetical protein